MVITYHGDNYFRFQAGNTVALLDPTNVRSLKGAAVVLHTISPAIVVTQGREGVFSIEHQGEYQAGGITIRGWHIGFTDIFEKKREQTVYRVSFGDITLALPGFLKGEIRPEILGELKGADVLIIPGCGKPWIAPRLAAEYVRELEPGIVIPSLFTNAKELAGFLQELNQKDAKLEEKLAIKQKDISPKGMQIQCLKPQ